MDYLKAGGNQKAFEQTLCFLRNHSQKTFRTKKLEGELEKRCTGDRIRWQKEESVVIMDYTKHSNFPRFYLFDLRNNKLHALFTSHGRFGDTSHFNKIVSFEPKRNSILRAAHFSNVVGSNATSGGFYLTGIEYQGSYGRSLVLHGLEFGHNHNSCERMTVIHKSQNITETSTLSMSSGCPMLAPSKIDFAIDALGEGALVYSYTPTESLLPENSCGRNLLE